MIVSARSASAAAMTVLVLAGCGNSSDPSNSIAAAGTPIADSIGDCPPGASVDREAKLAEVLTATDLNWFEATTLRPTDRVDKESYTTWVEMDSPRALTTGAADISEVRLYETTLDDLSDSSKAVSYIVGVQGTFAQFVAAIGEDGSASFIGLCTRVDTDSFKNYAATLGQSPATILRAIARDAAGTAAKAYRGTVAGSGPTALPGFSGLTPDRRQIDPTDPTVPKDLLARLSDTTIRVTLPKAIRAANDPYSICGRISLGYVQCASLSGPADDSVELNMYTLPGESLQIWLMRPASPDGAIGRLIVLKSTLLARPVNLRTRSDIDSPEQLADAARRGQAAFVLA